MGPSGRMRGRVGVISGADSDLGHDLARLLAGEGMSLVLIAEPGNQVRNLAETLQAEHGIRCFPAALDVTDRAAVDRIIMHAEQHVGAVDLLVNLVPGQLTAALLPTMEQRGRGHIVNVPPAPPLPSRGPTVTVDNIDHGDDVAAAALGALA